MSNSHDALVLRARGAAFEVAQRVTPTPGSNEVVVEVHYIALNPVDNAQHSMGFKIASYPAVLGFDTAGIIHAVGSAVTSLNIGDRVTAMASSWFSKLPQYGAFQRYVLVPSEQITVLPAELPLETAVVLPLAVYTAWMAFFTLDIPRNASFQLADKKGILIWGVGGSVGSVALQLGRSMGLHVYATASVKHHEYLSSLGSGGGKLTLFDYKDTDAVAKIVKAIKQDGVEVDKAVEAAAGNLKDIAAVLNQTKAVGAVGSIAVAPFSVAMFWYTLMPAFITGVKAKFVDAPPEESVRMKDFAFIFNDWLADKLRSKELEPSPRPRLLDGGLAEVHSGLAELKKGVSGVKLVLKL